MSLCLASKFGAAAVGIGTLAQVVPADPSTAAIGIYEKYGITGLLIAVVVFLWIDGKREAAKAEARRSKREEKDDKKHSESIQAINGLGTVLKESVAKCDATREWVKELKRQA